MRGLSCPWAPTSLWPPWTTARYVEVPTRRNAELNNEIEGRVVWT